MATCDGWTRGELSLEHASYLAIALKKPLEWLAGGSDLTAAPTETLRFSAARYLGQRKESGVLAADIRSALTLRRGEYRKLTQEALPVRLEMAARIAALLDVQIAVLCESMSVDTLASR